MTEYVFKLPDLGEGIVETELAEIYTKVGDNVKEDQVLAEVITEKAMVEVPSPVTGKVIAIGGVSGDILTVGSPFFTFEVGDISAKPTDTSTQTPAVSVAETPTPTPSHNGAVSLKHSARVLTSPSIRRLASEKGIDLTQVSGTGRSGRISKQDFDNYINSKSALQKDTRVTQIPVTGMRRLIAQKMQASKRSIPHFSYVEELDVTNLEELRQHMNETRENDQPKLSVLPFLMLGLAKAVKKFPQCNATYDEQSNTINQYAGVHIGVAAQTDKGLMVPVVKHAESMNIWSLAQNMINVSDRAKSGKASREELTGSTITLSSLGKLGGIVSTPVINAPEVCIIAVNKIVQRPMIVNGQVAIRKMMNLSSSFDHRIVDGYHAAEMIQYLRGLVEQPATLFV